jgi:hypothetical protein
VENFGPGERLGFRAVRRNKKPLQTDNRMNRIAGIDTVCPQQIGDIGVGRAPAHNDIFPRRLRTDPLF